MNNIFEGAKFGDKFMTRNNKVLIYLYSILEHSFFIILYNEKQEIKLEYDNNTGYCIDKVPIPESDYDIVSHYQEPIDEETIKKLSKAADYATMCASSFDTDTVCNMLDGYMDGFIAGYKKAKEE